MRQTKEETLEKQFWFITTGHRSCQINKSSNRQILEKNRQNRQRRLLKS